MDIEHPLEAAHRLRRDVVLRAADLLAAEGVHYYLVVRSADRVARVHACRGVRVHAEAERRWNQCDGVVFSVADFDPDLYAPTDRLAEMTEEFWAHPLATWAFSEVGYHSMLATNVLDGEEHRGLVAFVRAGGGPWIGEPRSRREATRIVVEGFRAAWSIEAALAPPAGQLTCLPSGEVLGPADLASWASRHAFGDWAARAFPKAPVGTPIGRTVLRGGPGTFVTELKDPRGGATYVFDPVTPIRFAPLLILLTPRLRRVAGYAAAGATNQEIASAMGKSVETVREQLGEVYRRLGVASRAELATLARKVLS